MSKTEGQDNTSELNENYYDPNAFDQAVDAVRHGSPPEQEAEKLYERLTNDEKLSLLDGDIPFWIGLRSMLVEGYNVKPYVHGEVARLGIKGIRFVDGPRGCVAGISAAFPCSMARGATWDIALEEKIGQAIACEIRAQDGNFFGGVCINVPRHPAWGRVQGTYGEDPFFLGEFGAALTRGVKPYVMACVKHFALNSIENARFKVNVIADEKTLHDVYLPHFKRVIDEGADAIMASYNSVNGEWMCQNEYFLTKVLKDLWGFKGITISDFICGIRDVATSIKAGLDIEAPFAQQRAALLKSEIDQGKVSYSDVKKLGIRILETQLRFYATQTELSVDESIMACQSHRQLARVSATRSMVLLKNDPVEGTPVLPISEDVRSIAVIGRLATQANLGDHGSSNVRPPSFVSPIDGIRLLFRNANITLVTEDDPVVCQKAASETDVAVVIAGYSYEDEGEYIGPEIMTQPELVKLLPPMPNNFNLFDTSDLESNHSITSIMSSGQGGDRTSLRLRQIDVEIIKSVSQVNKRTVIVIVCGGAVIMEEWRGTVPAILVMWYAGMESGYALADILSGRENPCGRLPFSIPSSEDHLPFFDSNASSIVYDRFYGQRLLDRLGVKAAFPLGFGLSYTRFIITQASILEIKGTLIKLNVTVQNIGNRAGRHVIQVYGKKKTGRYKAELMLTGFGIISVKAGESATIAVDANLMALAEWDQKTKQRIVPDPSEVILEVSSFIHDPDAIKISGQQIIN